MNRLKYKQRNLARKLTRFLLYFNGEVCFLVTLAEVMSAMTAIEYADLVVLVYE